MHRVVRLPQGFVEHMTDSTHHQFEARLLASIITAQTRLLQQERVSVVFDGLLTALLELAESEYGFIGEVHLRDGLPFLKTHAITNIAWDDATRKFYDENAPAGMEFSNLDTLFGTVMTTSEPVFSNHPASDPRRGSLPEGHPPLRSFMGLPFRVRGKMGGMVGVANRRGGYDEALAARLEPFLQTCANIIFAIQADRERTRAEQRLELQESRTRQILDGLNEAVITIDSAGTISSANAPTARMFGYPVSALVGENVSVLFGEEERKAHGGHLQNYLETGAGRAVGARGRVVGKHRDGHAVHVELSLSEIDVEGERYVTGILRDLAERLRVEADLDRLASRLEQSKHGQLVGRSDATRLLLEQISAVSGVDWPVIVQGETGSGKELVARAIHSSGRRSGKSLVSVNCAAISDDLLESRLFGHRRGSFTGAVSDQPGMFEAATGGTLFLDEIGDISPAVQRALLRVLQEGEVLRIGETKPRKVDVRVIVATNRLLAEEVKSGRFRTDLYYRLRVGRVDVPPLRVRNEDILLLARTFLAQARFETGSQVLDFDTQAIRALMAYNWPGNVRELRSVVQVATLAAKGSLVTAKDLSIDFRAGLPGSNASAPGRLTSNQVRTYSRQPQGERDRIIDALDAVGGRRQMAAELLGVSRATLYRKIKKYGIELG